jgi:uncharacterized protein involved in exopolysaccharide biosynthesis/Mrp family chromosome partitioning ATPase
MLVCGVLAGLLGAYQVWRERPVYDSTAEIVLRVAGSSHLTLVYGGSVHQTPINPATEANIMMSDAVLARVAKNLNLANDPRFAPFARPGSTWDAGQPEVRAASLALLRAGLSVRFEDTSDDVKTFVEEETSSQSKRKQNRDAGPRILYVSFSGPDPLIGGAIVNAVIQAYEERTFELRHDAMLRVSAQLSSSMEKFKRKVEAEQRALLDLERRGGLSGTSADQNPDAESLAALTAQADFYRESIRVARAEEEVVSHSASARLSAAGGELTLLRIDAALAREQEAQLTATYGPRHPAVQAAQARVDSLQDEIATAERRFEAQVAAQAALADTQAKLLSAEIGKKAGLVRAQQEASVAATALQVQLARDSELYYVLANNARTAELDAGYGTVTVQTLKEADIPGVPQGRDYVRRMVSYGLAGLVIGFAIAALRAASPKRLVLELPCLAQIPQMQPDFAQAMDELRRAIQLSSIGRPVRRIAFANEAGSEEEAATVAIGLATALARHGERVLLIDANLGMPTLHRKLGLDGRVGLSTVLSGPAQIEAAAISLQDAPCVDVLPAGPRPPKPAELVGSDAMRLLLDQAEQVYSYVVLVAAPLVPAPVAATVLAFADIGILVATRGGSSHRSLMRSAELLRATDVPLAAYVRITGVRKL